MIHIENKLINCIGNKSIVHKLPAMQRTAKVMGSFHILAESEII